MQKDGALLAGGGHEFLVKWRGYNEGYNLWIGEEQFNLAAQELLAEYKEKHNLLGPVAPAAAPAASSSSARPNRGRRQERPAASSSSSAERAQQQGQARSERRAAREAAK